MDFETFEKLAKEYTAIPVSRRLMADVMTPVSVFLSLRQGANYPFLLESVEGGEQLARYTFLGRDPFKVLICEEEQVRSVSNGESETLDGDYFEILREWTSAWSEPDLPDLPSLTGRSEEHTSELQSRGHLVCRLLLEKKTQRDY